jgi:hypothetical protein
MIQTLLLKLTTDWNDAITAAGLALRPPLSVIQLAGLRGMNRKVNFLVFDTRSKNPVLILKVARSLQHQLKLQQEYNCLRQVSAFPFIADSVPRPIAMLDLHGHTIVAETFLPGLPLTLLLRRQKRIHPHDVAKDLIRAQQWLESLQQVSGLEHADWSGEVLDKLLYANLEMRSSNFRCDLSAEIRKFDGLSVPLTASHGDFWPGNLLINEDRVGVIDWESFRIKGSPLHDSFLFITTYARSYPWLGWKWMTKEDAFHKAFLEENWFSRQVRGYINRIFLRMNLPVPSAHLMFSEFLITKAQEESGRVDNGDTQWREYLSLYSKNSERSIFRDAQ